MENLVSYLLKNLAPVQERAEGEAGEGRRGRGGLEREGEGRVQDPKKPGRSPPQHSRVVKNPLDDSRNTLAKK
jgi:hypothetical protein